MVRTIERFETAFDTYKTVRVLGEGGSGRVFLVSNSGGEKLALKCLFPEVLVSDKRKRFKNEIDFCSKQFHRNLIRVLDSGVATWGDKTTPFYVMPFFPQTLRQLIEAGIPQSNVLPLFAQMLDGVEAAHLLNVVHRDLKPENFLWDPAAGLLVAGDFGIAHFEEELLYTAVETRAQDRLANFLYSAPEQRIRGRAVDRRADIYALGLILNEMFTGVVPHGAGYKTVAAVAAEYAYLDLMIDKMIQQAREARPGEIEQVKRELIGRQNEFIALQHLDERRREVVSVGKPPAVVPVNLIGVDWRDGNLLLKLDQIPAPAWITKFQHPEEAYRGIYGHGPETFQFQGDTAIIRAEEGIAQQLVDNFKRYAEMATRSYAADLVRVTEKAEQLVRQKIAEQVAAAERRARLLKNLRI
jgi:serine/threonine protein kinase